MQRRLHSFLILRSNVKKLVLLFCSMPIFGMLDEGFVDLAECLRAGKKEAFYYAGLTLTNPEDLDNKDHVYSTARSYSWDRSSMDPHHFLSEHEAAGLRLFARGDRYSAVDEYAERELALVKMSAVHELLKMKLADRKIAADLSAKRFKVNGILLGGASVLSLSTALFTRAYFGCDEQPCMPAMVPVMTGALALTSAALLKRSFSKKNYEYIFFDILAKDPNFFGRSITQLEHAIEGNEPYDAAIEVLRELHGDGFLSPVSEAKLIAGQRRYTRFLEILKYN